ncbi:DeoR/GlpR family DNA-binding transcription regulator [Streptomyces sp. HNM0574]|uniref:DeoR/GlpR family DNA-binding transcription regulator n=1 Tax=Streptomyces sp. HNM0574 TaxID=2714954 RepID=UPI00146DFF0B|nr:DeoR/GlpR family DNA-binding transcription regulator [Streptomyces sp. HNM0574]NLU68991.1 DeoR/GlpR transcriptional regulator [Streptomyces sp. HNM0574]
MLRESRHEQLLRFLREESVLHVTEIARRLAVSEATARRDLDDLGRAGRLTRVYGGAVARAPAPGGPQRPAPTGPAEAEIEDLAAKDAVARAAAARVRDGELVLLDYGTTALRLARLLRGRDVTVATGNLAVYEELRGEERTGLILLGGRVRSGRAGDGRVTGPLTEGPLTEAGLGQLYADRLFLGASGILPDGRVLTGREADVPVKQALLASARQVVLLATARKLPGSGTARVCGPGEIDVLVTGSGPDPDALAGFRESAVEIVEVVDA